MKTETIVAFAQTKKRNIIGMVGIEIDLEKQITYVRLAKQWKRDDMARIPGDVKDLYDKIKWNTTYADQLVGQHLLKGIEYEAEIAIFAINTQKNIKEPEEEEGIKRMDLIEMTQFMLSLKQVHKIQFPKKPTKDMLQLIQQTEMFSEVITEQGSVNYYAPGEELDGLVKSLMICCFAGRPFIEKAQMPFMIVYGEDKPKDLTHDVQETMERLLKKKKENPLLGYRPGILK